MADSVTHATAFRARVRVGFGPLDVSDLEAALRELEQRTARLATNVADVDERWADETDALRSEVVALRARVDAETVLLRDRDQTVAVGGLRPAVFGLFLNGLGLLVTAVGLVVSG